MPRNNSFCLNTASGPVWISPSNYIMPGNVQYHSERNGRYSTYYAYGLSLHKLEEEVNSLFQLGNEIVDTIELNTYDYRAIEREMNSRGRFTQYSDTSSDTISITGTTFDRWGTASETPRTITYGRSADDEGFNYPWSNGGAAPVILRNPFEDNGGVFDSYSSLSRDLDTFWNTRRSKKEPKIEPKIEIKCEEDYYKWLAGNRR